MTSPNVEQIQRSLNNRVQMIEQILLLGIVLHPSTTEKYAIEFEMIGMTIENRIGTATRPVVITLPEDLKSLVPAFCLWLVNPDGSAAYKHGLYRFDEEGKCIVPIQQPMKLGVDVTRWHDLLKELGVPVS